MFTYRSLATIAALSLIGGMAIEPAPATITSQIDPNEPQGSSRETWRERERRLNRRAKLVR